MNLAKQVVDLKKSYGDRVEWFIIESQKKTEDYLYSGGKTWNLKYKD